MPFTAGRAAAARFGLERRRRHAGGRDPALAGLGIGGIAVALAALPGEIRRIVEAQEMTRFDRCHFLSYAESSLQLVVVYFVLTANYTTYADAQQAINLAIFRRFEELGVRFAHPTRTVHVEGMAAEALQSSAPLRSAGQVG
ncbi:MAG: hypothetical protein DIU56_015375 [Pseudomonadota bacterium]|jgi:hypothetical protein|nr:MAG: hypothetical protein DIU56_01855 [Pseudomonadota bacterium]